MQEEFVQDFPGKKIIGIRQYEENGDILILTFPGRKILGKYIKSANHTIEFPSRRIVGNGDLTIGFLYKGK